MTKEISLRTHLPSSNLPSSLRLKWRGVIRVYRVFVVEVVAVEETRLFRVLPSRNLHRHPRHLGRMHLQARLLHWPLRRRV